MRCLLPGKNQRSAFTTTTSCARQCVHQGFLTLIAGPWADALQSMPDMQRWLQGYGFEAQMGSHLADDAHGSAAQFSEQWSCAPWFAHAGTLVLRQFFS